MKLSAFQCLHKVQTSWLISGQWTKLKFRMTSWIPRSTWGGRGMVPSCTTFEFILYFGCSSWSILSFLLFTNIFVCREFSLFVCFSPPGTSVTLTLCHKGLTLFISHLRNWDQPCFQNRDQPYHFSNVFISSVQNEYHPYFQNQDQPSLLSNLSLPKVSTIININPFSNMVLSQIFSQLFHE